MVFCGLLAGGPIRVEISIHFVRLDEIKTIEEVNAISLGKFYLWKGVGQLSRVPAYYYQAWTFTTVREWVRGNEGKGNNTPFLDIGFSGLENALILLIAN